MVELRRSSLIGIAAGMLSCSAAWGQAQVPTITAHAGMLIRWGAPGTTRCTMKGRSWAPLKSTCYYPIDLQQPAGLVPITRLTSGHSHLARIKIENFDYGTEEVNLPDIPQAHPSVTDLRRDAHERIQLGRIWARKEGPPLFTLPLGLPATPLPKGKAFGVKRIFNGKPAAQHHTGTDYLTPVGTPIVAVADGTVVASKDLFFEGNAVMLDHGDGLISMYFHLADLKVEVGEQVKKGHLLGHVGSTGRATGPHLFFGIRWHNARIDPQFVLEDPAKIPSVN